MRDALSALYVLLGEYEDQELPSAEPSKSQFYEWFPLPLAEWGTSMELAQRTLIEERHYWSGDERFLDVGCGIGTKMRLAELMGWSASGLEYWEPYAQVARGHGLDVTVTEASGFEGYDTFDLVYIFRLCVELDDEAALTAHIASRMRLGALLFHAGGPDPDWLEHIGESVWRVV